MGLYAPTRWFRCTLTTVGALIEGPAENAPPGSYRKVHLLLLDSPTVEITLDVAPDSAASRDAYWARPPLNKQLCISLGPEQSIVGRAQDQLHELSVIVEHWHGGSRA